MIHALLRLLLVIGLVSAVRHPDRNAHSKNSVDDAAWFLNKAFKRIDIPILRRRRSYGRNFERGKKLSNVLGSPIHNFFRYEPGDLRSEVSRHSLKYTVKSSQPNVHTEGTLETTVKERRVFPTLAVPPEENHDIVTMATILDSDILGPITEHNFKGNAFDTNLNEDGIRKVSAMSSLASNVNVISQYNFSDKTTPSKDLNLSEDSEFTRNLSTVGNSMGDIKRNVTSGSSYNNVNTSQGFEIALHKNKNVLQDIAIKKEGISNEAHVNAITTHSIALSHAKSGGSLFFDNSHLISDVDTTDLISMTTKMHPTHKSISDVLLGQPMLNTGEKVSDRSIHFITKVDSVINSGLASAFMKSGKSNEFVANGAVIVGQTLPFFSRSSENNTLNTNLSTLNVIKVSEKQATTGEHGSDTGNIKSWVPDVKSKYASEMTKNTSIKDNETPINTELSIKYTTDSDNIYDVTKGLLYHNNYSSGSPKTTTLNFGTNQFNVTQSNGNFSRTEYQQKDGASDMKITDTPEALRRTVAKVNKDDTSNLTSFHTKVRTDYKIRNATTFAYLNNPKHISSIGYVNETMLGENLLPLENQIDGNQSVAHYVTSTEWNNSSTIEYIDTSEDSFVRKSIIDTEPIHEAPEGKISALNAMPTDNKPNASVANLDTFRAIPFTTSLLSVEDKLLDVSINQIMIPDANSVYSREKSKHISRMENIDTLKEMTFKNKSNGINEEILESNTTKSDLGNVRLAENVITTKLPQLTNNSSPQGEEIFINEVTISGVHSYSLSFTNELENLSTVQSIDTREDATFARQLSPNSQTFHEIAEDKTQISSQSVESENAENVLLPEDALHYVDQSMNPKHVEQSESLFTIKDSDLAKYVLTDKEIIPDAEETTEIGNEITFVSATVFRPKQQSLMTNLNLFRITHSNKNELVIDDKVKNDGTESSSKSFHKEATLKSANNTLSKIAKETSNNSSYRIKLTSDSGMVFDSAFSDRSSPYSENTVPILNKGQSPANTSPKDDILSNTAIVTEASTGRKLKEAEIKHYGTVKDYVVTTKTDVDGESVGVAKSMSSISVSSTNSSPNLKYLSSMADAYVSKEIKYTKNMTPVEDKIDVTHSHMKVSSHKTTEVLFQERENNTLLTHADISNYSLSAREYVANVKVTDRITTNDRIDVTQHYESIHLNNTYPTPGKVYMNDTTSSGNVTELKGQSQNSTIFRDVASSSRAVTSISDVQSSLSDIGNVKIRKNSANYITSKPRQGLPNQKSHIFAGLFMSYKWPILGVVLECIVLFLFIVLPRSRLRKKIGNERSNDRSF